MADTERESHSNTTRRANTRAKTRQQTATNRRVRGLTCSNCRARKVRCEGGQPTCKTCEIYHEECRYDKLPPMSQVLELVRRLQDAEETVEQLRAQASGGAVSSADVVSSPRVSDAAAAAAATVVTSPRTPDVGSGREALAADSDLALKDVSAPELSVDEHGKITYYGPTSAVHDPTPSAGSPAATVAASTAQHRSAADLDVVLNETRQSLAPYVREMATWEEFALGNASLQTGIPRTILAKLLHVHWTWVAPMFMWVYRPAFIRDMATGGRYYSEFLLAVMTGHAAKYHDDNCGDLLLARARRLLGTAIQQPSSIPTVQALLQLSARDLAHGSISQAWVYSGIAFRMASDLGLQHSGTDVKGLAPVDLEIRRRLFWGCYFWDKATSLYAGRLPAVTESLEPSSLSLLDDSSDLEPWIPYYGDSINLTASTRGQYPPHGNHSVSCFANSCRLSIIINDIVVRLYSKRSRSVTRAALRDIKLRLELWRAESPSHLRLEPDDLPAVCPPPHLVSQNMLFFASVILAHRPFWSVPAYYQDCTRAAHSIERLVLLLESTFGLENITYLMGYCIYTGASAILEDAKGGNDVSQNALRTFLRALNTGMRRCPLLERSLRIIVKGMNTPSATVSAPQRQPPQPRQHHPSGDGTDTVAVGEQAAHAQAPFCGYIPAFPYIDPIASVDFDLDSYLGGAMGEGSMVGLDCFPEMQMDLGPFMPLH